MGTGLKAALLGLALALTACGGASVAAPPAAAQEYLYVASQEDVTVAVIDMSSNELVATVDLKELGYSSTAKAHDVAVDPDGSHWYVSLIAAGKILKFDTQNRLVGEADFETPGLLTTDPTSDRLYVGRSMAAVNPPQRIGELQRSTMELEEIDVFFPRPHAMAVDPRSGRFFSASLGQPSVAYAPLGSEEVELLQLELHDAGGDHGSNPMIVQLAVSPDGRWLVGTGQMSGDLMVLDAQGGEPTLVRSIAVGGQPWHPSFTPDGNEVWVPRQTGNSVAIIDTGTWEVVGEVMHPALVGPHGSAVSPDGTTVYVSARNESGAYRGTGADPRPGTVVAIDRATREVVAVIEVGRYAAGMDVAPRAGQGGSDSGRR